MTCETHVFQAEVKQLLNLVIHSLYTEKEIFLRELLSNAADALDKRRIMSLQNTSLSVPAEYSIVITPYPDSRRLVVADNGIGMDKEELMSHLGTIAHSGTKEFLKKLTQDGPSGESLIGQFGVGFYSAFMVAERVIVDSCPLNGTTGNRWESSGDGQYTIDSIEKKDTGTRIELILREKRSLFLYPRVDQTDCGQIQSTHFLSHLFRRLHRGQTAFEPRDTHLVKTQKRCGKRRIHELLQRNFLGFS